MVSALTTLCIIKKSGSFRFLSVNIVLIMLSELIALGQILAKNYNAYQDIFGASLTAIIFFYILVAIFQTV